jgi:hypothetical protein
MSYSIIVKHKNGALKEIPISGHITFHEFWLPLFMKLGLQNLVNMQYSHNLEEDELALIISEYILLQPHLLNEYEIRRAGFIIEELKNINFIDYEYISIG